MTDWTHSICVDCWNLENKGMEPVRVRMIEAERCCFCGLPHESGIYIREDPAKLMCAGNHEAFNAEKDE